MTINLIKVENLESCEFGKDVVALYCIAHALKELRLFPIEALAAGAMLQPSAHAEKNAAAIRAAVGEK